MADRITRKGLDECFERFAKAVGKETKDPWVKQPDGTFKPRAGVWVMDCLRPDRERLCRVEEITPEGGAATPLGETRRTPRELCDCMTFAVRVIQARRR